jgi:UDP-glucuronate 4-epimerase
MLLSLVALGSSAVTSWIGSSPKVGRVTVVDNFDPFYDPAVKRSNIEEHKSKRGFRLLDADIRQLTVLRERLRGDYDVIVHLAAKTGCAHQSRDPVAYQQVNVAWHAERARTGAGVRCAAVRLASSSSVYGVNPNVPWREDDHVLLPISPYASTKVSGELIGHVYSHLYGIRFMALRFFTVYGPRQRPISRSTCSPVGC